MHGRLGPFLVHSPIYGVRTISISNSQLHDQIWSFNTGLTPKIPLWAYKSIFRPKSTPRRHFTTLGVSKSKSDLTSQLDLNNLDLTSKFTFLVESPISGPIRPGIDPNTHRREIDISKQQTDLSIELSSSFWVKWLVTWLFWARPVIRPISQIPNLPERSRTF